MSAYSSFVQHLTTISDTFYKDLNASLRFEAARGESAIRQVPTQPRGESLTGAILKCQILSSVPELLRMRTFRKLVASYFRIKHLSNYALERLDTLICVFIGESKVQNQWVCTNVNIQSGDVSQHPNCCLVATCVIKIFVRCTVARSWRLITDFSSP